jgi:hypothetical protein
MSSARHGQTDDDFEVGHLSADFVSNCVTVPSAPSQREGLSDMTFLFSSEYICANIPVGTYHPSPAFVGLFLLSLLRSLSSQLEDAIISGTIASVSCPMFDMLLCVVLFMPDHTHSGSSFHPFPHSSFVGWILKMTRSKRVSRVPAGHSHAKCQAPHNFRFYYEYTSDQRSTHAEVDRWSLLFQSGSISRVSWVFLVPHTRASAPGGHSLTPLFSARV